MESGRYEAIRSAIHSARAVRSTWPARGGSRPRAQLENPARLGLRGGAERYIIDMRDPSRVMHHGVDRRPKGASNHGRELRTVAGRRPDIPDLLPGDSSRLV